MKSLNVVMWVYFMLSVATFLVGDSFAAMFFITLAALLSSGGLLIDYYFDKKSNSEKELNND